MRICIPVTEYNGLESTVYGHFGSAPLFVEVDTESLAIEPISNQDHGHVHGACNPMKAIAGRKFSAVLVGGIGPGALMGFRQAGIAVFLAPQGTVAEAVRLFKAGELPELDRQATCSGHQGTTGSGCGHH